MDLFLVLSAMSWNPTLLALSMDFQVFVKNVVFRYGKPLFEMCCFHPLSNGHCGPLSLDPISFIWFLTFPKLAKKCTNHPNKHSDPQLKQEIGLGKKSAPNHLGKRLHPPPLTGNAHLGTIHFKKGFL